MNTLSTAAKQFILHWGEMSSRWGINRSMAQIHALIYLSPKALHAGQISQTLALARSNVSNSLRELQAWGLVRVVHQLGDRRDYFESTKDAWEMFRMILEQRKRREFDPTIEMLRAQIADAKDSQSEDVQTLEKMRELLSLLQTISTWYEQMAKLPPATQKKVLRMGDRIGRFTGGKP